MDLCAQKDGFTTSADGTPLHYKLYGKGKPLVIINGGPGMNCNGFEALAKELSKNNLCILYDQRGTGLSKLAVLDSTTITMDLMVADLETLRQHLQLKKWSILGHSFGGILGSYYLTKFSSRVEKVIFSASGGIDLGLLDYVGAAINANLSKAEQDSLRIWNEIIARGDTTQAARLGRGRALAPAYLFNKKFVPVLAERLTQGNGQINQLVWDDLRRIQFDCAAKLKSCKQPVLLIQGKQDIIKAETAERAKRIFAHSKLVLMDHCGHYGWLDNPKVYFKEIGAFLK
jgi:proline iminopeptidase